MARTVTLWNQLVGLDADRYDFVFDDVERRVLIRGEAITVEFIRDTLNKPARRQRGEQWYENGLYIDPNYCVYVDNGSECFRVDRTGDSLELVAVDPEGW